MRSLQVVPASLQPPMAPFAAPAAKLSEIRQMLTGGWALETDAATIVLAPRPQAVEFMRRLSAACITPA